VALLAGLTGGMIGGVVGGTIVAVVDGYDHCTRIVTPIGWWSSHGCPAPIGPVPLH
jgi:hypothetical protein